MDVDEVYDVRETLLTGFTRVLKPRDRLLWSHHPLVKREDQSRCARFRSYRAYATTGKYQRGSALHAACRHAVFAMRGTPPGSVGEQSVIVACFGPIPLDHINHLQGLFAAVPPKQSPNDAW